MTSKGPKKGTGKPVASKAAARPKAAPKARVAAPEAEKPVPAPEAEVVAPPVAVEPEPVLEAASQEVETTVEAPLVEAAEAVVEVAETLNNEIVEPAKAEALATVTEAVAAAQPAIDAAFKESNVMETIENTTARAQAFFGEFNERTKAAVEKSTKVAEELNDFAKGNLEAIVESGKITAKGLESFGQEAAEYGRKSFENATAALKGMSSVKSPTEFFKLQSDFFRTSFDSYVAEASKNTEALLKLAGEAAQPLSNRVAVAAEKAKIAA